MKIRDTVRWRDRIGRIVELQDNRGQPVDSAPTWVVIELEGGDQIAVWATATRPA